MFFRGIHAEAKSKWLEVVCANKSAMKDMYSMDRYRCLEQMAKSIKGIGPRTIDETHCWLEQNL